jgi:Mpv17 / PMP22 family
MIARQLPTSPPRQLISLFLVFWIVVISPSSIAIRPCTHAFVLRTTPSTISSRLMVHQRSKTGTTTQRSTASSLSLLWSSTTAQSKGTPSMSNILHLRGGGGGDDDENMDDLDHSPQNEITESLLSEEVDASSTVLEHESQQTFSTTTTTSAASAAILLPSTMMINVLRRCSSQYTGYLQQYPIRTKSMTAGMIFAMSDLLAQLLTKSSSTDPDDATKTNTTIVWTRILSSAAVGLFYFGPAAHYWYSWIFRILPSTSLFSTLQKAILGQLFFGPSFTCIFFAMSLIQSRTFTLKHWFQKIRSDLPSAWIAGAGYWPIVDLISYSYVPPQYIPLFVNICSFFWTTYLVVKSYK